jgi:DNA transformation protein and related proteins
MAISKSFREFLLDQFRPIVPNVRAKAMFGGLGVYAGDLFFAIVAWERVFLKVSETTRPDFEAIGMGAFQPFGEHGPVMSYYELPLEILESGTRLQPWLEKSLAVAIAQPQKKAKPKAVAMKSASKRAATTQRSKTTRKKSGRKKPKK